MAPHEKWHRRSRRRSCFSESCGDTPFIWEAPSFALTRHPDGHPFPSTRGCSSSPRNSVGLVSSRPRSTPVSIANDGFSKTVAFSLLSLFFFISLSWPIFPSATYEKEKPCPLSVLAVAISSYSRPRKLYIAESASTIFENILINSFRDFFPWSCLPK